ncbi:MAG TPA: adenylate/guanylate cyclase domain-containing protein [Candidatus Binatia bacterium]|jgi:class 3 adenylate cyclase/predicted ATPase|nr:adenylate/guanylate cyclase domain-containing protein [Candidatus Binatia bacterium]
MTFDEVLDQVRALLQQRGRVTYRSLKRRFALDDEYVEDLKGELIRAEGVAADEDGDVLVWTSAAPIPGAPFHGSGSPPPAAYTPPHLAERIRAEQAALEARSGTDGERKTITALFADLKGSTALIEGLDPEAARAIIDPALQLMMDAVHQYDGYVAQALGDGIFALFGAPIAHEDHPQRAVYAALRMQEAMRHYADTLRQQGSPPLHMRVGLNTGEVVVRSIRKDDLHTDYVPVGHSTNLAARMEQLANPGSIVVSTYTHHLTDGYFAFKDLGATQIKGVEEPLNIYEVVGIGALRTRLQVAARRGLTQFVGRQSEMEQLRRALAQAKAGHGQIVGTMGEPGLGKSRLFYEFKLLSSSGCLVLEAYSVSHGKATAYLPVIELLKSYFDIQAQDDERKRREKVTGKVLNLDRSLEDTLPYLFALLGIEEQPSPLRQMDPQIRRQRTFEALKKLFLRESLNQPLVLIFEDLHWIDGETQGFLDVLSESVASAKLLLLTNYRPEYRHEWGQKTYYTQLRLAPLSEAEAEELLTFLLGHDAGLTPLKQLILDKTQGTPFFMEEVVQTLAEEGVLSGERGSYRLVRAPTVLQLPATVQGILAARIDRLAPDEKALLQQLAVIGRQFPMSLVRHVIAHPEADLYRLLTSLQRKEFLYEQPAFPESDYIFKHALTQDVAYGTVLQEQRKVLHEQTGQALETMYNSKLEEYYGALAHHYSRSANTEKAIHYLQLAGQQAVHRSAHTEAISHLTATLDLLKTLPESAERNHAELQLLMTLGPVFFATKGYGSPEAQHAYLRAQELCDVAGNSLQLFQALWGVAVFHFVSAEYSTTFALGERLFSLAQDMGDRSLVLEAHLMLGITSFWSGAFITARGHLESALALYDTEEHREHAFLYGQDPAVGSLSYLGWTLWHLGYPDQALTKAMETVRHAETLRHPFSMGMALNHTAWLHQLRSESREAQKYAEIAITLAQEHGFPYWAAEGMIFQGWALTEQAQIDRGLAELHEGLAAYRATSAELGSAYWLALLAEAYGKAGQAENGLAALAEVVEFGDRTAERCYEAEVYRLKGELTLRQESKEQGVRSREQKSEQPNPKAQSPDPESEAEACFLKAIAIAHKQQAKSLELRAVMSLARLWRQQSKSAEAHRMLSEVYNWFTEGFDTKDLQEAKALIDELS